MNRSDKRSRSSTLVAVIPTLQREIVQLRSLCDGLQANGFKPSLVVTGKKLDGALTETDLPRVSPQVNPGFGAAVREGIAAEPDWCWLMILNDDTQVDTATLGLARDITEQYLSSDGVLAYFDPGPRRPVPNRWSVFRSVSLMESVLQRMGLLEPQVNEGPWYKSFSCSLISRGLWDKLDGFDRRLIYTYEDADFGRRALDIGAVVLSPRTGVLHEGNSTSKKHIDTVLPVSAYSAREYLVSRGDPRLLASTVVAAALLVRCLTTPFVGVPVGTHLRGIWRSMAAIATRAAPHLPLYEDC